MAVQCPYCRHELSLKTAPPGMYTTACPDCGRKFYLAVPEDPEQPPIAAPIPAEREQATRTSHRAGAGRRAADESRRRGRIESRGRPVLTLPEHARSTATLPGPAEPAQGPGDEARLRSSRLAPSPGLACGRVGSPSARRLSCLAESSAGPPWGRCTWRGSCGSTATSNLKVMKLLWARNAPFVARFTREAMPRLSSASQPGSDP